MPKGDDSSMNGTRRVCCDTSRPVFGQIIDEQVGITVIVKVNPVTAFTKAGGISLHARLDRDLNKGAVALVVIEAVVLFLAADKQV